MPEITIGLYPDVAATWMLARLPAGLGAFLALTGSQLGAADCLRFNLADYACDAKALDAILQALAATDWSSDVAWHTSQVDGVLQDHSIPEPEPGPGPLQRHSAAIRHACGGADFKRAAAAIERWKNHDDPWLARAAITFLAGSPGSARLGHTRLARARHQSLAEAFREDYIASLHCCALPDFREGIRALLIDKDKSPRWQPSSLQEASADWVARFLVPPWPDGTPHPLADLA